MFFFFTEEFSLLRCSFTRSCMDEACLVSDHERMISLVPMYC